LHSGENHEKRRVGGSGCAKQIIECGRARMNKRGDALGMFGVRETFKETIRSPQRGKRHFCFANERCEAFAMALAGFAEEDGFDWATRAKRFFDEANAFDSYGAGFRGQAAAQRHAEFLEPTIVAAAEDARSVRGCSGAGGFAWSDHYGERSKFRV
jgi:hypothetical protein